MKRFYKIVISWFITFLLIFIYFLYNNQIAYITSANSPTPTPSTLYYPPIANATITSDYGPRTSGSYDFHFGIDLANGSRSLIRAIDGGQINIVEGSSVATIAIGNWEYLHITKDAGYSADGYHLVKRSNETLKYYHPEKKRYYEVTRECIVFWTSSTEVEKVLCNSYSYPLIYQYGNIISRKEINAKSSVVPGEGFALVGDTGSPGSIHLHLQIRDGNVIKNPLIVYPHDSANYNIRIDEPTNNEEISHSKPESEKRIKFNINSTNGKDLEKVELFLFHTIKDKPQETDLINNHNPQTKGLFDYAGRLGNTQEIINGFPRHMFVKYNESGRGSWNQTGVSPSTTGDSVGNDDFYFISLNTKIFSDGSNCDDVLQAKYPDGEYYFFVRAYSILGKTFDQKQQVLLNNWTPQIKSFTTNSTPDKPLKAGDTIEIKIEFTEQMDTGKKPKVEIWDAKASQWKALALDGVAWSNSSDGRIKDALLKASATLPEWGETKQGTTQELKVKVTEALLCLKVRLISDL